RRQSALPPHSKRQSRAARAHARIAQETDSRRGSRRGSQSGRGVGVMTKTIRSPFNHEVGGTVEGCAILEKRVVIPPNPAEHRRGVYDYLVDVPPLPVGARSGKAASARTAKAAKAAPAQAGEA